MTKGILPGVLSLTVLLCSAGCQARPSQAAATPDLEGLNEWIDGILH